MARRATKTAQTRERLLETASHLFRAQGFHATGLDEVLKLSDTPKGSLYHYFPGGKDQLAVEALGHVAAKMEQRMSTLLASNKDPAKALRALLDFTAKSLMESDFRNGCPIAGVTVDVACENDSLREACDHGFNILLEVFTLYMKGAGLSEKRAKSLAILFLSALEGAIILSRAQKNVTFFNAVAGELVQLIRGVLQSPSRF